MTTKVQKKVRDFLKSWKFQLEVILQLQKKTRHLKFLLVLVKTKTLWNYLKKKSFFIDISGNYSKSLISVKTNNFISCNYKSSINLFDFYQNNSDRNIKNTIANNSNYVFGKTMNHDPINYIMKKINETE